MGDAADMLLNGVLCEACGVFLDGEEPGFPRYCSRDCAEDRGAVWVPPGARPGRRPGQKVGPYRRRAGRG